jgi:hypothetical protein
MVRAINSRRDFQKAAKPMIIAAIDKYEGAKLGR